MVFYGRFLSIKSASTAKPTMTKTNRPAIAGTKYCSDVEIGTGVGAAVVAGAFITSKVACEYDPQ